MEEIIKDSNTIKEYKQFDEMYNVAVNIIFAILGKKSQYSSKDFIKFVRNEYDKEFLNSFFIIGKITQSTANMIGSKTLDLKLSMDNLLKNMIEHPEISLQEYSNIQYYLENADYILLKNTKNIIYFKIDNKIYQFVIKSTKDGSENSITTFHKSGIKQLQKDIKRYKQIKR